MSTVIHKIPEDEKREEDDCSWSFSDEGDSTMLFRPFFGQTCYETPVEALEHDKRVTRGALDVLTLIQQLDLDTYGVIKLVNYLRSLEADVQAGQAFCEELKAEGKKHKLWQGETFLIPTDPEDPFLCVDFHQLLEDRTSERDVGESQANERSHVVFLQQENLKLKQELEWLKLNAEGRDGILSVLESEVGYEHASTRTATLGHVHSPSDEAYFQSYNSESIHREMLSDKVRTEGYRRAIESSRQLFEGKTVMDVGCGTGILALLACRAGAKCVYAVDASQWASSMAQCVAKENGFHERIHVFHSKVEDIQADLEAVDIIVSEWMGYALLFESMLSSVLYARDKWLRPSGLIFPDKARLLMAGASQAALDTAFWKDVCGFSMTCIADDVVQRAQAVPLILSVKPEHILTIPYIVHELNLQSMDAQDADFTTDFKLSLKALDDDVKISAIIIWFEVEFQHASPPIKIDTSPSHPSTHWCQTVLALKHPMSADLTGNLSISQEVSSRNLHLSLLYQDDRGRPQTSLYSMKVAS